VTAQRLPRTAAVLGGGAVGSVLLPALRTHGVRVVAAWSRSPKTPQWRTGALPRAMREAELVLLAVADAAIAPLCAQLVAERLVGPGQIVAHLAGALDLTALAPALGAGARIGSLHPLRAVPPGSRGDALAGSAAGIDGSDEEARGQLTALALALGMHPFPAAGSRALYHAAAVLAGGAQVALFAEAVRAFQVATGSTEADARAALLPLARGALDGLAAREPSHAITGPVPRGDAATLAAHLRALDGHDARTAALYRQLARVALTLVRSSGRAPEEQLNSVDRALATEPTGNRAQPRLARPSAPRPAARPGKSAAAIAPAAAKPAKSAPKKSAKSASKRTARKSGHGSPRGRAR